jgi:hypothetical protein
MNAAIDVNDLTETREAGLRALGEARGPAGMVRFMQQYENGYGDYTKEKQQQPDWTVEEIDALLNTGQR